MPLRHRCHHPTNQQAPRSIDGLVAPRQVTIVREMGQMKAALVIGDPCRLESIARFFGPNGVPLPMPPREVVDTVVRAC